MGKLTYFHPGLLQTNHSFRLLLILIFNSQPDMFFLIYRRIILFPSFHVFYADYYPHHFFKGMNGTVHVDHNQI